MNSLKPEISIVVPIYQVEQYIKNCMQSIGMQSFTNFEVILVNDGTLDSSVEIAEEVLREKAINYQIINQDNQGTSVARNVGIRHSEGEWIICVDPDDVLNVDLLAALYNQAVSAKQSVSICNYQIVNEHDLFRPTDQLYKPVVYERKTIMDLFLVRKINIVITAMLIKKSVLYENDLWYEPKIRFGEDAHFIWRLLLSQDTVLYNRTPLYNYFVRQGSTTTSSSVTKMMTSYDGFLELTEQISNTYDIKVGELIMARHVLSLIHVSARHMDYHDFLNLCRSVNLKKYIQPLITFPDIRVKVLALIMAFSPKLSYIINGRL